MGTRSHIRQYDNWHLDKVLLVWGFELMSPGNSHPRRNAIWISQDQGDTWNGPFYVDVEVHDAGYADMLYNPTLDQWVYISYQGTSAEAVLKQYNLTITGI